MIVGDAGVGALGLFDTYKNAFFTAEFLTREDPGKLERVNRLKELLNEQMSILEKGITIHAMVCPEDMESKQEELIALLSDIKGKLKLL